MIEDEQDREQPLVKRDDNVAMGIESLLDALVAKADASLRKQRFGLADGLAIITQYDRLLRKVQDDITTGTIPQELGLQLLEKACNESIAYQQLLFTGLRTEGREGGRRTSLRTHGFYTIAELREQGLTPSQIVQLLENDRTTKIGDKFAVAKSDLEKMLEANEKVVTVTANSDSPRITAAEIIPAHPGVTTVSYQLYTGVSLARALDCLNISCAVPAMKRLLEYMERKSIARVFEEVTSDQRRNSIYLVTYSGFQYILKAVTGRMQWYPMNVIADTDPIAVAARTELEGINQLQLISNQRLVSFFYRHCGDSVFSQIISSARDVLCNGRDYLRGGFMGYVLTTDFIETLLATSQGYLYRDLSNELTLEALYKRVGVEPPQSFADYITGKQQEQLLVEMNGKQLLDTYHRLQRKQWDFDTLLRRNEILLIETKTDENKADHSNNRYQISAQHFADIASRRQYFPVRYVPDNRRLRLVSVGE